LSAGKVRFFIFNHSILQFFNLPALQKAGVMAGRPGLQSLLAANIKDTSHHIVPNLLPLNHAFFTRIAVMNSTV
jgi:hypothetical protein